VGALPSNWDGDPHSRRLADSTGGYGGIREVDLINCGDGIMRLRIKISWLVALLLLCLCSVYGAEGGAPLVMSAPDLNDAIAKTRMIPSGNLELGTSGHQVIKLAVVTNRNGEAEKHVNVDDCFYVLRGKAIMRLGGRIVNERKDGPEDFVGSNAEGYHNIDLLPGTLVSVPRNTVHQILAKGSEVVYLVIKGE
jgi:mannose-6-phosphate isomerase-like protein (cupin superfamily)